MKTNKIIAGLVVVVIGLAAFLLWRQFSRPTINLRSSNAVGEVLAEEVLRMLGPTGRVVLIGRSASRDGGDEAVAEYCENQLPRARAAVARLRGS